MKKLSSLLALMFLLASVSRGDSWTQKTSFGGAGRSYLPIGFSIGTKAYVGAGYNSSTYYNDFWEWDQTTNVWTQKANYAGAGRIGMISFAINGKGYAGTGQFVSTQYNTFYEYNPVTNIWTAKANFPGTARSFAIAFSIGNKGYVGSGGLGSSSSVQYNDFYEYNPSTNSWTAKANFPTMARTGAVGLAVGNKGYVGLGWTFSVGYRQDWWEYDTTLNTWTQKANFMGSARTVATGFPIGNKAYVGMGYNGSSEQQNFFEWDQASNTWTAKANFGGGVRSQTPRGMSIGGKGYAGLGYTGTLHMTDWWEYDPYMSLSATGSTTGATCNANCDGTATANPNGGMPSYTYLWNDPLSQTTATATGLCPGNYSCTVTDAMMNSVIVNVTVTEPAVLTVSPTAVSPTICAGSCTILNSNVSGGTAGYTFTWSPGGMTSANPNVCPTVTTTYTCTVIDANGCVASDIVAVIVDNVPAQPSTISGNNVICQSSGQTYSVVNDPGATGYTWNLPATWSGSSTTNSITPTVGSSGGTISVTANNSCGSSTAQTFSVTVNPLPATPSSILGLTAVCSGSPQGYLVTNDPSATSYTWSLPATWTGSSTINSIMSTAGTSSGIISVTANNSCGSSTAQTLNVTVNTTPVQPSSITGSTSVCEGTSQPYSVTNDVNVTSYTWSLPAAWSGSSTTNSINSTAGTSGGTISVTGNNSCGTSTSQTLSVTVNPLPAIVVSGGGTVCENDNVCLTATGGFTYFWFNGNCLVNPPAAVQCISMLAGCGGIYQVLGTDANGCSDTGTVAVTVNPLPTVTVTLNATAICVDNAVFSLTGGSPAGGTFSGTGVSAGNFNASTAGVGTHTITYSFTDGNGCTDSNTDQITVNNCTGIADFGNGILDIVIYPNPFTSEITLSGNFTEQAHLEMFNSLGESILSAQITSNHKLQTSNLAPGMYVLCIRNESVLISRRIVKE
ncbi:MAG: T9SS type A sorting domain-containing protein [Flavobacteriales bacterium]